MDIQILWKYESGIIILLIDIGHHKDILGIYYIRYMDCMVNFESYNP